MTKSGKSIDQLKYDVKELLVSFKGLEELILSEQPQRPFTDKDLLLDNQASISVFCNKSYLTNIREADGAILIAGVSKDKLRTTLIGDVKGLGTVYYNPDAIANILCFYDINKRFGVTFDSVKFTVMIPELNQTMHFTPIGKLYVCKNAKYLLERPRIDKKMMKKNHFNTANLSNGEKLEKAIEPELMPEESSIALHSIGQSFMDIIDAKDAVSTSPISKDDRLMIRSKMNTIVSTLTSIISMIP